jgi:hypothetical protein
MINYVVEECIMRREGFPLRFVGLPDDPMHGAVERVNHGVATEVDLIALSAFPVFDHEMLNNPKGLLKIL